jgi:hypothetical protein
MVGLIEVVDWLGGWWWLLDRLAEKATRRARVCRSSDGGEVVCLYSQACMCRLWIMRTAERGRLLHLAVAFMHMCDAAQQQLLCNNYSYCCSSYCDNQAIKGHALCSARGIIPGPASAGRALEQGKA